MIVGGFVLPEKKNIVVALTYIFGIGFSISKYICNKLKIKDKKVFLLSKEELKKIKFEIKKYKIEGELKKEIFINIRRLIDIKSYRGLRHLKFLPVRGQRTRNNSKTRRKRKKYFFVKNER